ncbi:hypothetical protein [Trebonia kvetii]|uniref:hypothetical protein n=1 Tax=Trebonia kvetii TaxID=2480626 RepID=UPI003F6E3934
MRLDLRRPGSHRRGLRRERPWWRRIGHLLGASGARLMPTLLSALEQHGGPFGLQTMCTAGSTANTTVTERL